MSVAFIDRSHAMDKGCINPITRATEKLGCTQVELAHRMGVSTGLISMWKLRGYITQRHLAKACEVTGLAPHELNPFIPDPMPIKRQKRDLEA